MDVKELTKVGKRCFPILLILIILCTSVSASYWNFLTIGQGDQRYCLRNGPCELSSLIVDTINVTGTLFVDIISKRNVTRESITITDNLTFDGGDLFFKDGVIENPNYIQFNTTYTNGSKEGRLQWSIVDGTIEIGMPGGNVNLQIGQEMLSRVVNKEGETITNCQAVFVSGATGANVEVKTPIASNSSEAPLTFALATENISDNGKGYVTLIGKVRGCDTSMWSEGDVLYLSPTEEGNLTNIPPIAPNIRVVMGIVERSNSNEGVIAFNPTVVQRIQLASDVYPFGLTNNSILQYNSNTSRFEFTTSPTFDDITIQKNFTGNQFYGEMFFHNDSTVGITTVINTINVFVNITGFNQIADSGQTLNGFTYDNANEFLSPLVVGMYDCSYDISAGNAGNNQEYQFDLAVNGVEQDNTDSHRKIGAAGDVGDASDRGFISMNPGDELTLMAKNIDATANLFVHAASINCVRIGS